jgi:hypothetical protein
MKYTVEIGSAAMIYIPGFIKTDSAIQQLIAGGCVGGEHRNTTSSSRKPTCAFIFFYSK